MAEKKRGAVKTVGLMMAVTAVSKLLGMARQMIFGSVFAESAQASAFLAAFSVSLSLFDILFAGAIAGGFIPMFGEAKKSGTERAEKFSSSFLLAVSAMIAAASALLMIFPRTAISVLSPAMESETAALAARLLRIMMPASVFAGVTYIFAGLLQSNGMFILPAAASSVSNIMLIICLALFPGEASEKSIVTLSFVYTASWAAQAALLVIPAYVKKAAPKAKPDLHNADMLTALKKAPAVTAGSWLLPLGLLAATFFAPFISDTAITSYNYAYNIFIIVSGVLTYGVCNFVFPKFSAADKGEFAPLLRRAVKSALLLVFPFTAGSAVLSLQITEIIYLRGNFSSELAFECASLLTIFAFAMPFFAVYEVLCRAFYSAGKARIPAVAALSSALVCVISNLIFFAAGGKSAVSLAVSFLLSQITAALILCVCAKKHFALFSGGMARETAKSTFSAAVCGVAMYFLNEAAKKISAKSGFLQNLFASAIVFSAGCVVYLICIYIFGLIKSLGKTDSDGKERS